MALSALLNIVSAPSLAASKIIQDLTYTAQTAGAAGNSISLTYVDPGMSASLSVSVVGSAITVHLANSGSAVTSTATQIKSAVDGSGPASALVSVVISGTGSTVETAQSLTSLAGGFDTALTVPQNENVPLQIAITNSGGSPVVIDAIYPKITSPSPQPSFAISNPILPQPLTIAGSTTAYVPFSCIIFGTEHGIYVVDTVVCSSASSLIAEPSIKASITI